MTQLALCLIGLAAGVVTSGGVFAFIVMVGIIPRLVQRTKTADHIILYESVISLAGVLGTLTMLTDTLVQHAGFFEIIIGLGYGVFVGCLAVAIAEVLNVIPILCRRLKVAKDVPYMMLILALGKVAGVLAYFFLPGFLILK